MVVPLYIGELAPPRYLGALVSFNQLAITSGILISFLLDCWLAGREAPRSAPRCDGGHEAPLARIAVEQAPIRSIRFWNTRGCYSLGVIDTP